MKLYELATIGIIVTFLIGALFGTAVEEDKDAIDIVKEGK